MKTQVINEHIVTWDETKFRIYLHKDGFPVASELTSYVGIKRVKDEGLKNAPILAYKFSKNGEMHLRKTKFKAIDFNFLG